MRSYFVLLVSQCQWQLKIGGLIESIRVDGTDVRPIWREESEKAVPWSITGIKLPPHAPKPGGVKAGALYYNIFIGEYYVVAGGCAEGSAGGDAALSLGESAEAITQKFYTKVREWRKHASAAWFYYPVPWQDSESLRDYPDVIQNPMDLGTVLTKLEKREYQTIDSLRADLDLIWDNACKYNMQESEVAADANKMRTLVEKAFAHVKLSICERCPKSLACCRPKNHGGVCSNPAVKGAQNGTDQRKQQPADQRAADTTSGGEEQHDGAGAGPSGAAAAAAVARETTADPAGTIARAASGAATSETDATHSAPLGQDAYAYALPRPAAAAAFASAPATSGASANSAADVASPRAAVAENQPTGTSAESSQLHLSAKSETGYKGVSQSALEPGRFRAEFNGQILGHSFRTAKAAAVAYARAHTQAQLTRQVDFEREDADVESNDASITSLPGAPVASATINAASGAMSHAATPVPTAATTSGSDGAAAPLLLAPWSQQELLTRKKEVAAAEEVTEYEDMKHAARRCSVSDTMDAMAELKTRLRSLQAALYTVRDRLSQPALTDACDAYTLLQDEERVLRRAVCELPQLLEQNAEHVRAKVDEASRLNVLSALLRCAVDGCYHVVHIEDVVRDAFAHRHRLDPDLEKRLAAMGIFKFRSFKELYPNDIKYFGHTVLPLHDCADDDARMRLLLPGRHIEKHYVDCQILHGEGTAKCAHAAAFIVHP